MPETQTTPLWAIGLAFFCSMMGAAGQAFFKIGSKTATFNPVDLVRNWHLMLGLASYAAATVIFIFTLKHGKLSTLYPVIAMSYVWVFLISWGWFREFEEKSPIPNMAGVTLILAGVVLVALGR